MRPHTSRTRPLKKRTAPGGIDRELIEEPARIEAILEALGRRGCRGSTAADTPFQVVEWTPGHTHPLLIAGSGIYDGCEVALEGDTAFFTFEVSEPERAGDGWRVALPNRMQQVRRRIQNRGIVDDRLMVHVRTAGQPESLRRVHDVSQSGLGFLAEADDVLQPGTPVELTVEREQQGSWTAIGQVTHTSARDGVAICGLQLKAVVAHGKAHWRELVQHYLFRGMDRGVPSMQALWKLYEDLASGK